MSYLKEMSHGQMILIGVAVVVVIFVSFGIWNRNQPGEYDTFAQCLADEGVTFYGAYWCPHCQDQKAMFGRSERLLPYVECSTPSGQGQLAVCNDAGIESYPTWILEDGTTLEGVQTFEALAEATGCQLPS